MFFCCADKCLHSGQAETIVAVPTGKVFSDDSLKDEIRIQVFPDEKHPEETQSTEADSAVATSIAVSESDAQHAEQFAVTVCKSSADAKIGLDIVPKDGKVLKVKAIKRDSPVKSWNAAHVNKRVKTGDRVVEVNGVHGDAEAMLSIIATTQDLIMVIERPW